MTRLVKSEGRICLRIESSAASHTEASPETGRSYQKPFISRIEPQVFNKPLDHHTIAAVRAATGV